MVDNRPVGPPENLEPELLRPGAPWGVRIALVALVVFICFAAATIGFLMANAKKESAINEPIITYVGKGKKEFKAPDHNTSTFRAMGPRDAAMTIQIVYPFGTACIGRTLALAFAFAKEYPEDVRLEIYDLMGPEGERLLAYHGIECAHVLINGKYVFGVKGKDGKIRKVSFEGVEGDKYKVWDLYVVLRGKLNSLRPGVIVGPALPGDVLSAILEGNIRELLSKNPFIPKNSPTEDRPQ